MCSHIYGRGRGVKRRWRARTPKPVGRSVAHWQREASWSAERQFRFAYETGALGVSRRILSHTQPLPCHIGHIRIPSLIGHNHRTSPSDSGGNSIKHSRSMSADARSISAAVQARTRRCKEERTSQWPVLIRHRVAGFEVTGVTDGWPRRSTVLQLGEDRPPPCNGAFAPVSQ